MKAGFDTVKYLPGAHIPNASWFHPPAGCNRSSLVGGRPMSLAIHV